MELKYVNPQELKQVWNQIKPSLSEIAELGNDWIPEDAYCDIKVGKAQLYLVIKDGYFIGYIITQLINNSLHVWAAYSNSHDILSEGLTEIIKIANKMNAKEITFSSYRKGWEKIAPTLGFKPYTWRLEC
jgi:hypothetical protein